MRNRAATWQRWSGDEADDDDDGHQRRLPASRRGAADRASKGSSRRLGAVANSGLRAEKTERAAALDCPICSKASLRRIEQIDPQADLGLEIRRVRSGVEYGSNRV